MKLTEAALAAVCSLAGATLAVALAAVAALCWMRLRQPRRRQLEQGKADAAQEAAARQQPHQQPHQQPPPPYNTEPVLVQPVLSSPPFHFELDSASLREENDFHLAILERFHLVRPPEDNGDPADWKLLVSFRHNEAARTLTVGLLKATTGAGVGSSGAGGYRCHLSLLLDAYRQVSFEPTKSAVLSDGYLVWMELFQGSEFELTGRTTVRALVRLTQELEGGGRPAVLGVGEVRSSLAPGQRVVMWKRLASGDLPAVQPGQQSQSRDVRIDSREAQRHSRELQFLPVPVPVPVPVPAPEVHSIQIQFHSRVKLELLPTREKDKEGRCDLVISVRLHSCQGLPLPEPQPQGVAGLGFTCCATIQLRLAPGQRPIRVRKWPKVPQMPSSSSESLTLADFKWDHKAARFRVPADYAVATPSKDVRLEVSLAMRPCRRGGPRNPARWQLTIGPNVDRDASRRLWQRLLSAAEGHRLWCGADMVLEQITE